MEKKEWGKYAKTYHFNIISPLKEEVTNPLFVDIKKIANSKDLVIADLGTGIGDLLPFLAENFKEVYAIDFSKKMIDAAKEKYSTYPNIKFEQADIRELTKLGFKFDIAISINSILHPSFEDIKKSFNEIYNSLNEGGTFIGIFPSMESILYNFMLLYEREYHKYNDEEKALQSTKTIGEKSKYNFITATYEEEGEKQKFYYKFELSHKLKQAKFKKIRFKKVLYPWGEATGGYEDFPGMPKMWDWYVIAVKEPILVKEVNGNNQKQEDPKH